MKLDSQEPVAGNKRLASNHASADDPSPETPGAKRRYSRPSSGTSQTSGQQDTMGHGSQSQGSSTKTASPTTSLTGAEIAQAADVDEQVPRRLRPQDPDLEIREVTNDGEAANMEMLIHLKEIFHAQLPKMPKEYIVRLVFDRKHRSIVLTKKGTPIGGITYRPFKEQKFGEIAFCAVVGNAQVQGHGSRLMNELKKVAIRDDITHFHTYADNYAIGYFAKHGFTKNLTMSRDRWVSYVKDYDGGTHMECYVHPTIPYLAQAEMYAKQRDWVVNRIAETSASTRIYPGLPAAAFEDGNVLRHIDIPGVQEAGWTEDDLSAQNRRKSDRDAAAQHKLRLLWREIEKNDNAWPFRDPVDLAEVPDYTKVVAHPIDLSQIRDNIEDIDPKPIYESKERMKVDLDLMISNCKTYNAENTDYWAAADALEQFIEELYSRS